MMNLSTEPVKIAVSLISKGQQLQFMGTDAIVKEISISRQSHNEHEWGDAITLLPSGVVEIDFSVILSENNFKELFEGDFKITKISEKKVRDCSVRELLFAIRKKSK